MRKYNRLLGMVLLSLLAAARGKETPVPNLFDAALEISVKLDPETNPTDCRKAFDALIACLRKELDEARTTHAGQALTPRETIAILNRNILIERKVSYISNLYWRDSLFTSALTKNRGNCLSTSLLYVLAARELKLPVHLIFLPRHALARWEEEGDGGVGTALNIETTAQGKTYTDTELMRRFQLTDTDREEAKYLKRLSDDIVYAQLLLNWSGILESMARKAEAETLLAEAQKWAPELPDVRAYQATAHMRARRPEEAEPIFRSLLADARGPWLKGEATLMLVCFLESQGRFKEAVNLLTGTAQTPLELQVRMLAKFGELCRHRRDFDKAIKMYELLVAIRPDVDSYNELGSVLTEAHKDPEAIAAYEKALELNPEDFFSQVILAGLYERSGNRDKGRSIFAKIEEPRGQKATWYGALVWYYANINEEALMLKNMELGLQAENTGHMYQYFVREPDLDPYREHAAFVKLMQQYAPQKVEPVNTAP